MAFYTLKPPEDFQKIKEEDFDCLNSYNDLSKAMIAMKRILELTVHERQERQTIRYEISKLLHKYYPNSYVAIFGSSVNGFGFQGCDLDLLFLPFPEYCNLDFQEVENIVLPSPTQVLERKFPQKQLLSLNEPCHLKFVQRIMYTKRWYFRKVIFIPAKCPILNIQFVKSPISCDFSASNRMVISNTELQWFYGKQDHRVIPLIMFLRYWAKSLGITQKSCLSSYAFSFLVIFYLQNVEPPVLPSVESLIKLSDSSFKIDGWETAFCKNLDEVPISNNSASLRELLMGFFDFYWNFDFIHYVVSPHWGRAIPVEVFLQSTDERIKSFPVTAFSIQDPFILSRNISRNAAMKTTFKLVLFIAKRLLQKRELLFQNFFDFSLYVAEMNSLFLPILGNFHSSSVSFSLYPNYKICHELNVTNDLQPWYETACQTVLDILQYGLLIECEIVDKVCWNIRAGQPQQKKRKLDSDYAAKLELIMSIQCTGFYNTWTCRKKILVTETELEYLEDESVPIVLRKEHSLSKSMIQGLKNETNPLVWFHCNCYKYSASEITDIVLIFSPLLTTSENLKAFSTLCSFLKSYVLNHCKKILNDE